MSKQITTPEEEHRAAVEYAVREGQPVRAEVLADYPDLAAKYGKGATAPAAKEPHEMTAEEYAAKLKSAGKVDYGYHEDYVERALLHNIRVPDNAVAPYPHLAEKYGRAGKDSLIARIHNQSKPEEPTLDRPNPTRKQQAAIHPATHDELTTAGFRIKKDLSHLDCKKQVSRADQMARANPDVMHNLVDGKVYARQRPDLAPPTPPVAADEGQQTIEPPVRVPRVVKRVSLSR